MSVEERKFMKSIDDKILNASANTLKELQELDKKTQLKEATFYDAFAYSKTNDKKENFPSKPQSFHKSKRV